MPEKNSRTALLLTPSRLAKVAGIALTLLVAALYLYGLPLLDVLELKTYDMRLRSLPSTPPHQVTIATIDERSLAELGRWPWSRATLAKLVDRLDQAGARVIGFDIFFSEPESREADTRLARAIRGRKTVLSAVFLFNPEEARFISAEKLEESKRAMAPHAIRVMRRGGSVDGDREDFPMPVPHGVLANVPELQRSTSYIGHINVVPDEDGSLRRVPLVHRFDGRYVPSADVQAARAFLGGDEPVLHIASYGIAGMELGKRFLPTDEFGRILVRYRGGEQTFATVSIADIFSGKADTSLLRDRVVLIGNTAKGIGDMRVTPWGTTFPGVEVRANVIQNLIEGGVLQQPEWVVLVDIAAMIVLGLTLAWLLPLFGVRNGGLFSAILLAVYLFLVNHVFQTQGLWLNAVYPSLLVALLFVSSTLVRYFSTESEKRHLRTAFQHYVPATVIDEIVADASKLRLGGEKRELTVLFSDIRGFTTLSETLAPEELVGLLNVYFTAMTGKIFAHKGSLDKYIGDAIMAVFGAPISDPQHPRLACRAGLDMMRGLAELHVRWKSEGHPLFDIGIGINTGPMIVGNMGSLDRFNYTVVGDAVNLASRIEALNKDYGTNILVSEDTYEQVKDEFPLAREVDRVRVRGRTQSARLYELIHEGKYASLDWLGEFADIYAAMRGGDREAAAARFDALHARVGDKVSAYHARACRAPSRRGSD